MTATQHLRLVRLFVDAPSFIRFGSFQIHTADGNHETLSQLLKHTITNHFPEHTIDDDDGIITWLKHVAATTAEMIAHWMRVGFVHGVMNTDNMSIHGLTIDYGPYGWLENYDPIGHLTQLTLQLEDIATASRPKLVRGILLDSLRLLRR